MKFKSVIANRLNRAENIRAEFMQWYRDYVVSLSADDVVLNEDTLIDSLAAAIIEQVESDFIPSIVTITRDFAQNLADILQEKPPKVSIDETTVDIFRERVNVEAKRLKGVVSIQKKQFTRKGSLNTEMFKADFEASSVLIEEVTGKSGNPQSRIKNKITFGSGKIYSPIFSGLYHVAHAALNAIITTAANDVSAAMI